MVTSLLVVGSSGTGFSAFAFEAAAAKMFSKYYLTETSDPKNELPKQQTCPIGYC